PPNPLPHGLALAEIRGVPNYVNLIYLSSEFPALPDLDRGNMIVSIARDNTTYVPASGYSSGGSALISCDNLSRPTTCTTISQTTASMTQTAIMNVTVSGHPGLSFYPQGQQGYGRLT